MSYEVIPELTPEMAAVTAEKFGVSVEEVYRQWEETKQLNEQGGVDAVMASMGKILVDTEETVDAMVELADEYLDPERDRLVCLGECLQANVDGLHPDELDKDTVLHALVVATYKLAEANRQINTLLDGSRRQAGET
jgi:hypothetical protein